MFSFLWLQVFDIGRYQESLAAYFALGQHQHINQILEILLGETRAYVFFERSYGDMHSFVRTCKKLREDEAARLFYQIASAVAHCHDNGLVLRDLKLRKFVFKNEDRWDLQKPLSQLSTDCVSIIYCICYNNRVSIISGYISAYTKESVSWDDARLTCLSQMLCRAQETWALCVPPSYFCAQGLVLDMTHTVYMAYGIPFREGHCSAVIPTDVKMKSRDRSFLVLLLHDRRPIKASVCHCFTPLVISRRNL